MTHFIARARAGDGDAADALAAALRPRLTRMAAYYARRCGEDPDDLLQEAWVGLLEALPQVDMRVGSPEQYLLQRARWRLLDSVKRARVRRCAPLDETLKSSVLAEDADGLSSACVAEFLTGLKPSHRELLSCLMDGLTWREAGDVLGCTSANVAYHMRRIKREWETWNGGPAPL